MNNLKKLGLSALAGSLVAVSAQAGELSVTGAANLTYVTGKSGDNSAQSLGSDKDVKFSGSGELDNGWTFAIHTLSKDDLTVSSTGTVITMGSMGSIGFGTGGGTNVNGAYDEPIPTAYEENSDAGGQAPANYVGSYSDDNAIVYQMPSMDFMGATISGGIEYSLQSGSATANDGGSIARSNTWGNSYGIGLTATYDALSVGAYVSERENKNPSADTTVEDAVSGSWFAKYNAGPVSIGYAQFMYDSGLADSGTAASPATTAVKTVGTHSGMFDGDMMSIAFNVNDDLSLSWSEMTSTYDPQNHSATGVDEVGVDEKHESLQLAYSMGGMSIKAAMSDVSNANYSTTAVNDYDVNTIAVSLAF